MNDISYSELRRNLAGTLDRLNADHEPVIITRDRGKPAAAPMSLEDYASFEETRYLLASPKTPRVCAIPLPNSPGARHHRHNDNEPSFGTARCRVRCFYDSLKRTCHPL